MRLTQYVNNINMLSESILRFQRVLVCPRCDLTYV